MGHELLLPGSARRPDRGGERLEPELRLLRLYGRAARHGRGVRVGGPLDRSLRRAQRHGVRHGARFDLPVRAVAGAHRGAIPGRLGVPRRGDAARALRRRVRRAGAGAAVARAASDLVSDAVRRFRLDGLLGRGVLPERGRRLAPDAGALRGDQPGRLPAAQLVRARAARGPAHRRHGGARPVPRRATVRRSRAACDGWRWCCSPSSCRSTALSSRS